MLERFLDRLSHQRRETTRVITERVENSTSELSTKNHAEDPALQVAYSRHLHISTGELSPNATDKEVASHEKETLAAATEINSAQQAYERERARESALTRGQQIENAANTLAATVKLVGRVGGALLVGVGEGIAIATVEAVKNIIKRIDGPTAFILGCTALGSAAIPIMGFSKTGIIILNTAGPGALIGGIASTGITLIIKSATSKEVNTQPAKEARSTQEKRNGRKNKRN